MHPLKRALAASALCLSCGAPALGQGIGFTSFSAVVAANGKTARGLGVEASSNPAAGRYIVEFTRPIAKCAHLASPLGSAGGQLSLAPIVGQPTKIEVRTFNKSGIAANGAFTVLVSCPTYSTPG